METGGKREPLSEGRREKIKLRATYINGIALAFVIAGMLTIPISIAGETLQGGFGIPFAALCIGASFRLHVLAQTALEELDR